MGADSITADHGNQVSTSVAPGRRPSDDDVVRGAALKLELEQQRQSGATSQVGDRKVFLCLLGALAVTMLTIDALGMGFVVQRKFQGDSKMLLAAFSIAMGVNASQVFAIGTRLLMLHLGNYERRELVLRQTTIFRSCIAIGSAVCVCILLAGLLVAPSEVYASNVNPELAGCSKMGCATIMAALSLVFNAANISWLLSTMFAFPSSMWYRWHNGLELSDNAPNSI